MELTINDAAEDGELAALADRARSGGERAFTELVHRIQGRVRRWARLFTQDWDEADDVAQLVLMRLHAHIGDFEGRSRLTTWLYRITLSVALERRRREERRATLLAHRTAWTVGATAEALREPDYDASRLRRLLRAHAQRLPTRQRQVFELAELRGATTAEIAAQLRMDPATVRVTLLKARRRMRLRMLAEHPRLLEEYRE
ncbi:MAG TPA: RNA polymerase sigma factor [Gemmatimonadaceae bacterium]|nr:RNA polymerase sigma factor [Gemmatimonadaceae bacterium]